MGRFVLLKYCKVKIEQALVQHLNNHRKISLQGIGTFTLEGSASSIADPEKIIVIPNDAVTFTYNPKVPQDEELINGIVKYTKKIKPLAAADLDSFLTLGMQFLHIGKPFTIEGLGTLDKVQSGELIFIPGQFITPKIEAPKALKANENEEKSGLFPDYNAEKTNHTSKIILIGIILLMLVFGAWAAYYFLNKKNDRSPIKTAQPQMNNDSSIVKNDVITTDLTAPEDYTFMIMFKETTDKDEALKLQKKYTRYGHKIIMYSNDSIIYKLAEPFKLPLSDTTRIKDSLNKRYYVGEGRVEIK